MPAASVERRERGPLGSSQRRCLAGAHSPRRIGSPLPGPGSIYVSQTLNFTAPVSIGDTVTAVCTITDINDERRRVTLKTQCLSGDTVVIDGEADLAGNQVISDMLTRLRSHLHTFRLYYHAGLHSVTKNEHLAVVAAIAKHDPDGAEEAMRAHLASALERLETFVDGGNANAEARQIQ